MFLIYCIVHEDTFYPTTIKRSKGYDFGNPKYFVSLIFSFLMLISQLSLITKEVVCKC